MTSFLEKLFLTFNILTHHKKKQNSENRISENTNPHPRKFDCDLDEICFEPLGILRKM